MFSLELLHVTISREIELQQQVKDLEVKLEEINKEIETFKKKEVFVL